MVGLVLVKLLGPGPWTAAAAVGLAMLAMHLTATFHPPAGIDPLVVDVNDLPWSFLVAPVGLGAVLLALFAFAWHNALGGLPAAAETETPPGRLRWPARWW